MRADLILCYKMLHGFVDVFFSLCCVLEVIVKKLSKPRSVSVRDANMFSKRVVNIIWNSFSDSVVSAPSINSFKRRLSSVCLPVLL